MSTEPKKLKHRKHFKGTITGRASSGAAVSFGTYALKALEAARMTSNELEAARKFISKRTNRNCNIIIRMFTDTPVTAKASDSRMGGGKGHPDHYVAKVYPGKILCELKGNITEDEAKSALIGASSKLSFQVKFVKREEFEVVEFC